jgi:hypothetical protein
VCIIKTRILRPEKGKNFEDILSIISDLKHRHTNETVIVYQKGSLEFTECKDKHRKGGYHSEITLSRMGNGIEH